MNGPSLVQRLAAEFLGTFVLVFGGCGSAVLAANHPATDATQPLGIGFMGVALAFGLTVLAMAYAVGHVSGGHFNPAVTLGAAASGRFAWKDTPAYIVTQVIGGIVAAGVLLVIAKGKEGFEIASGTAGAFATNGYGDLSPFGYSLAACLLIEVVLTAVFLYVILGATDHRAPAALAPVAIGLSLTLIHLISIPVTNTSVNPARSLAVAVFAGSEHLGQVWLFWVAPIIGALIAGFSYKFLLGDPQGEEYIGVDPEGANA